MAFSRQMSSFLEAGIPILSALEIVGEETASEPMRVVIDDIRESVLRGESFSGAASAHGTVFPTYYLAMLVSAEYTGHLDEVLFPSSPTTWSATSAPGARSRAR